MAGKKSKRHSHSIRVNDMTHQELEYQLMKDLNDSQDFIPLKNSDEIDIDRSHKYLVIRYNYKNKHDDGFQFKEIKKKVSLFAVQFRMARENGKLWCYNVFKIDLNDPEFTEHDMEIEPPLPPIP